MTEYIAVPRERLKRMLKVIETSMAYFDDDSLTGVELQLHKLIDSKPMQIDVWVTPENELLHDGDWHKFLYENCQPLYSIPKPKE